MKTPSKKCASCGDIDEIEDPHDGTCIACGRLIKGIKPKEENE